MRLDDYVVTAHTAMCKNGPQFYESTLSGPDKEKWQKAISDDLKCTSNIELVYSKQKNIDVLRSYVDADFGADPSDRKFVSGCLFEVFGNVVNWSVRKQGSV